MNKIAHVFLIILIFLTSCFNMTSSKTGLEGKSLPVFNLLMLDSSFFNTKNIPNGHVIVLFYFGPNCPYSNAQMKEIIRNIDQLKNIRFYIFSTSSFTEVYDFYKNYSLERYSNITIGIDDSSFFTKYFNPPGVPYMAIYGKDRKLHQVFIGQTGSEQIKKAADNAGI